MMPSNLVTELATNVGWVQSQVTKQQTLKLEMCLLSSGLATLLATNISSLFQNCASEYLQQSALR